jgi:hypothetical protein
MYLNCDLGVTSAEFYRILHQVVKDLLVQSVVSTYRLSNISK